jgi:hypothetical protein
MPIVQPDTTQAEDLSPIEPGTYRARISECGHQKGKEKGTNMIVPKFKVTVNGKERPRTAYLVIEGPGAWNFDQLLRACNMVQLADDYRNPAVQPKPPFHTDRLVNQEVNVVITEDLYQGQKRDKITGFLRV